LKKGRNLPLITIHNQQIFLNLIRTSKQGISRTEIAKLLELSSQTISNLARKFIDLGLVREFGKQKSSGGKPRILLQIVYDARHVVGIHLDPAEITYVLLDLEGQVISNLKTLTPKFGEPMDFIKIIVDSVKTLLANSGVDPQSVLGVGIASPGPIDHEKGVIRYAPHLKQLNDFPLRDQLEHALGLPIFLQKDVLAALTAERWFLTTHDPDNFIFFYYGTGIGVGIVNDGQIVNGQTRNAGDIEHILVSENGILCQCGRRGCWGVEVRPEQIVSRAVKEKILVVSSKSQKSVSLMKDLEALVAAERGGDKKAIALLKDVSQEMANGLLALTNLQDIDTVIFGGPFWHLLADSLMRYMPDFVQNDAARMLINPPQLSTSDFGLDVVAVGAGCFVLEEGYARAFA